MSLPLKEFRMLHKLVDDIYVEAENLGWTWETLANKSKLALSTVSRLGNYETVYPRAATVFSLAKAVGFEVTYIRKKLKLRSA